MTGRQHKPDSAEEAPEQPAADGAAEDSVVGFPRANLRRIWKDWAEDQIATGRARRKGEEPAEEEGRARSIQLEPATPVIAMTKG